MKPRVTLITLGVDDLERSLQFYRDGLGFPTKGIVGTEFEHGAVAFFELQSGLKLAIWPRADLAHDADISRTPGSPTELSLGHNVSRPAEVDAVMDQASRAGARIVKHARRDILGRLRGIFPGPGRASVGGCMESGDSCP